MKIVLNLLLPLGLAFIAGVMNFAVLSRTTAMQSYIEVTANLKPGDTYKIPLLKQVKVAAKVPGAIPWEERNVLATLRAPRPFEAGDWVMHSDIVPQDDVGIQLNKDEVALNVSLEGIVIEPKLLKIGQPIGFVIRQSDDPSADSATSTRRNDKAEYQIVGPFRVVTLGAIAVEEVDPEEEDQLRPPKTISVAVSGSDGNKLDAEAQLLSQAIEQTRITAIVLYPTERPPTERPEVAKSDSAANTAAGEKNDASSTDKTSTDKPAQ